MTYFLQFFIELAANNHKDWFDENRKRYEKVVKDPFKNFIQAVITEVQKHDASVQIAPNDAIFRINRDIRFSKDKSPYKLDRTAVISPKGRKDHSVPGFYLSLGPEKLMFGGGAYFLPPANLKSLREFIISDTKRFNKLIKDKNFLDVFGPLKGDENKRLPNKEMTAAAEKQPLLYKKSMYYMTEMDPELILSDSLMDRVMDHYQAARPMQNYLQEAMNY